VVPEEDNDRGLLVDPSIIEVYLTIFVVIIASSINVLPFFVLNTIHSTSSRLGVIWAFSMLFSTAQWWLGSADLVMLFATSAA
jgi:hypothetical protein